MKKQALLALLVAMTLHVAATAQTTTFHAKGAFAQSNLEINGTQISLYVGKGDVGLGGSTFLDYSTFAANPDGSYTFSSGYGTIPDSAFTANNMQSMSLIIDTSQAPGFQASTCTTIYTPNYSTTCTNGPFGVIQLTWQQNGFQSSTTKSESWYTSGTFNRHMVEDDSNSSANATGTFLGSTVADVGSMMGNNNGTTVGITKP